MLTGDPGQVTQTIDMFGVVAGIIHWEASLPRPRNGWPSTPLTNIFAYPTFHNKNHLVKVRVTNQIHPLGPL